MRNALTDVTGTVALDDPDAAAAAIDRILARTFGTRSVDSGLLHAAFAHAGRLYDGLEPSHLACDLPYHDLRHALDAALCTARLVDGFVAGRGASALDAGYGVTAVLLALLHDSGFLRSRDEAALTGPQLAAGHESRSVAVARDYLRSTPLAAHAELAPMILATRVAQPTAPLFEGRDAQAVAIGCMVGTADLLCQVADPRYVERCYHHLYAELVQGGGDRAVGADGTVTLLFRDARDLVARTPAFCGRVVVPRLEGELRGVARHLAAHFGGTDPYAEAMRANVARCRRIAAEDRWDLVGPAPPSTTPGFPFVATAR